MHVYFIRICQPAECTWWSSFKVRRGGKSYLVQPYVLMLAASPDGAWLSARLRGVWSWLLLALTFGMMSSYLTCYCLICFVYEIRVIEIQCLYSITVRTRWSTVFGTHPGLLAPYGEYLPLAGSPPESFLFGCQPRWLLVSSWYLA